MKRAQLIFCDNIRRQRVLQKLSQAELAHRVGMNQTQFSRIENGKVEPGISTIEKIAGGLHVSVPSLFFDYDKTHTSLMDRISSVEFLSKADQDLIGALIVTFLEKNRLETLQDVKMKNRLVELKKLRG